MDRSRLLLSEGTQTVVLSYHRLRQTEKDCRGLKFPDKNWEKGELSGKVLQLGMSAIIHPLEEAVPHGCSFLCEACTRKQVIEVDGAQKYEAIRATASADERRQVVL